MKQTEHVKHMAEIRKADALPVGKSAERDQEGVQDSIVLSLLIVNTVFNGAVPAVTLRDVE
jgi:hypothetical protein